MLQQLTSLKCNTLSLSNGYLQTNKDLELYNKANNISCHLSVIETIYEAKIISEGSHHDFTLLLERVIKWGCK